MLVEVIQLVLSILNIVICYFQVAKDATVNALNILVVWRWFESILSFLSEEDNLCRCQIV